MKICGMNKTTLLDYPEHVAATLFTGGCNFCCPFCHNAGLVLGDPSLEELEEEEVLTFLQKRKGILTGVCITGGEPTLQADLIEFIRKIKQTGLLVKLDTNGYRPEVLQKLYEEKLLDYVAMDIKNSKEKYAQTVGREQIDIGKLEESVRLIQESGVEYEFRTTVVQELHSREDLLAIGEWLEGSQKYFLQSYQENENVISPGYHAYEEAVMREYAELLSGKCELVSVRGI